MKIMTNDEIKDATIALSNWFISQDIDVGNATLICRDLLAIGIATAANTDMDAIHGATLAGESVIMHVAALRAIKGGK
jgi:hypothetical protein